MDFEDLLELRDRSSTTTTRRGAAFRERYRAFTVDEYQDVNLLQQTLLERWLGDARRPLRRRRRLPVDLRLHRRHARSTCSRCRSGSRRDGRPAGGELPLDAAGARAREPARAEARRRGEDAACDAPDGPEPEVQAVRDASRPRRALVVERIRARRLPARGDRDPLPHERAARRLRGGAARGRHPVPGRRAARPRGRAPRCCACSRTRRPPRSRCGAIALDHGWLADAAGRARRARADAPERPGPARPAGGGSSRGTVARASRRARAALRHRRRGAARRPPAHLPRAPRASSSRSSSCRGSRRRSCRRSRRRPTRRSPRSGGCSTSA